MDTIKRYLTGTLLALGMFAFTAPMPASATETRTHSETEVAEALPPGIYLVYDGDELIGVLVIRSDGTGTYWPA